MQQSADAVRSVRRAGLQELRTQQLQCATVSQHSMYSYIVESGRERGHQHTEQYSKAERRYDSVD